MRSLPIVSAGSRPCAPAPVPFPRLEMPLSRRSPAPLPPAIGTPLTPSATRGRFPQANRIAAAVCRPGARQAQASVAAPGTEGSAPSSQRRDPISNSLLMSSCTPEAVRVICHSETPRRALRPHFPGGRRISPRFTQVDCDVIEPAGPPSRNVAAPRPYKSSKVYTLLPEPRGIRITIAAERNSWLPFSNVVGQQLRSCLRYSVRSARPL